MADKKTKKIVGFRVTSEHTGDSKKFVPLVKEATKKTNIKKAYADTAYDSRKNFNLLKEKGIEPAIKNQKECAYSLQRLSSSKRGNCSHKEARTGRLEELKDYGQRWIAEIVFSSFKRVLGESLRSRKFLSQKAEASFKVMLYNKFLSA